MSTVHESVDKNETVTLHNAAEIAGNISTLCLNKNFSDVTLIVGGEKLPAHKDILSVRSQYFECLFSDSENATLQEVTFTDVSRTTVVTFLEYIYSGNLSISSDIGLTLSLLGLAHQYSVKDLKSGIILQLRSILNLRNVCSILTTADLYDLEDLRDACHSFMDVNAPEVLSNDRFNDLGQKSMIGLLKRDTFAASEIEIFKSVANWCEKNNDVEDLVMQCVRLSSLSVVDIVSIVWDSQLVKCENLLRAIAEIVDVKPKISKPRAKLLLDEKIVCELHEPKVISDSKKPELLGAMDENIQQHQAKVIVEGNTSGLPTGHEEVDNNYDGSIELNGNSGYIAKLHIPSYLNHIQMRLHDLDTGSSYYVEVSLDQKNWRRVIEYSQFACRSVQNLYFEQQVVQYIKIVGNVGIGTTANKTFSLVYVEAYLKSKVPKFINGILYPGSNVATPEKGAKVIEGLKPKFLLNGDTQNYGPYTGYTKHDINGQEKIIVQLAQPFMISSMRLLLWDLDNRSYKYFIETSVNNIDWEIVVDRRNTASKFWQNLCFEERAVVFIRITGTHNTDPGNNGFHCVHFECPSQDK